jgi:RND family efflux transporter MFP subunit
MLPSALLNKLPFLKGRAWVTPVASFLGLGFALYMVFSYKPAPKNEPVVSPPQSYLAQTISGIGVVEPQSNFVQVATELGGVIRRVSVVEGDTVRKGDLLFALDTRDVDAQIVVLEKQLAVAKIAAQQALSLFKLVKALKNDPAVSKDDFNRRYYAHRQACGEVEQLKAQLHQARVTRKRLHVQAPLDGQILEVNISVGEYATPAGTLSSPLVLMGDVGQLYVRVEFDEEETSHLSPQASAYGFTRDNTRTQIPLTFVRFEPHVQPKKNLAVAGQRVDTRVLQVLYALPKGFTRVFTGQQLDVFVKRLERVQP